MMAKFILFFLPEKLLYFISKFSIKKQPFQISVITLISKLKFILVIFTEALSYSFICRFLKISQIIQLMVT